MKDLMLSSMVNLMPLMMPIMWVGASVLVLSIVLLLVAAISGTESVRRWARWSGALAGGVGAVFVACQLAGMALGLSPQINFSDAKKFEFTLLPFWQIGLALLIPGLVLRWLAKPRAT